MFGIAVCVSACILAAALAILAGSLRYPHPKNQMQRDSVQWCIRYGSLLIWLVSASWFVYLWTIREWWTDVSGGMAVIAFGITLFGLYRFVQTLPIRKWRMRLSESPRWNRMID